MHGKDPANIFQAMHTVAGESDKPPKIFGIFTFKVTVGWSVDSRSDHFFTFKVKDAGNRTEPLYSGEHGLNFTCFYTLLPHVTETRHSSPHCTNIG